MLSILESYDIVQIDKNRQGVCRMKIMFISDIHGIKTNLEIIREKYKENNCEKLIVLGDLYYIGPNNKSIGDYDISYVRDFLESFQDQLICMRGNCDSEVDCTYSPFPLLKDLSLIATNNLDFYLTHGHLYNENNWIKNNSILIFGHYHIPFIIEKDNKLFLNPGSISLPKNNNNPSYMIWNEEEFIIYDIFNNIIARKKI